MRIRKKIERKVLNTYKLDRHGLLRPAMLMNELQAIADTHAENLGAGRSFCVAENIAWVVTHYLIEIIEMPTDKEEIEISTWPSLHDALRAARDFRICGADGREMVRATSQWVMIDMETRKPLRLSDKLPANWKVMPERALDSAFDKFPEFAPDTRVDVHPRFDDFDVNQHINNAVYAAWATEALGFDFRDAHKLRALNINFKKEIPAGAAGVMVESKLEGLTSRHMIKSGDIEHANVICEWE